MLPAIMSVPIVKMSFPVSDCKDLFTSIAKKFKSFATIKARKKLKLQIHFLLDLLVWMSYKIIPLCLELLCLQNIYLFSSS